MVQDVQKAGMWKRISAAALDFILLFVVIEGLILLLSALFGVNGYVAQRNAIEDRYIAEYGIDRDMTEAELNALPEAEQNAYKAKVEAANKAYQNDAEVVELFGKIISLTLMITTLSVLVAFLILEFAVPLIFQNGQTLGKRIFGVAVMRIDCVKLSTLELFARGILGKCTFGTLVPIYLAVMVLFGIVGMVGVVAFGALLLVQAILFVATRYHTPLHDKLAQTVAVDMSSQLIFDSVEEMLEYKKRRAAEQAERREW